MGEKLSEKNIFEIIRNDQVFFKVYLKNYFRRFFNNEEVIGLVLDAFLRFNNKNDLQLYPEDLIDFGDRINFDNRIFGLRKSEFPEGIGKTYSPTKSEYLYNKLYTLLNCYRDIWMDIEPLERESYFHIQLIRITPFAINNEAIAMLILMSNLINSGNAPFLLNSEERKIYNNCIDTGDSLKLKSLVEKKSEEEYLYVINLYKQFYQLPMDKDLSEILINKV